MTRAALFVFFVALLYGCGMKQAAEAPKSAAMPEPAAEAPMPAPMPMPAAAPEATAEPAAKPAPAPIRKHAAAPESAAPAGTPVLAGGGSAPPALASDEINSYLVKVEANSVIKKSIDSDIPSSGQLTVWIGQPEYEPGTQAGMSAASGVLHTNTKAASAKITPSFPDDPGAFKVEPATSKCQIVEPTGSTAQFTITPNRTGQFRVGASVELYKSPGCTGDAATKTAEPITVTVSIYAPSAGLWEIAWSALENFFKEILAALIAVLVILFRKQIARLFRAQE